MKKIVTVMAVALLAIVGFSVTQLGAADTVASLKGNIVFKGEVPASIKINTAADPACQQLHPQGIKKEDFVVGKTGGLKNVFVYVKEGLEGKTFPPATTSATLTQKGCQYVPHVIGVQTGQALDIINDDATLHNVNAQTKNNPGFNFAQPIQGMKTTKKFGKAEIMISFICNVHPWMKSFIGIVDHPFFAVSDDAGQFEIKNLPAGTYVLEAWHEKLGTSQQKITVKAGETKTVSFAFTKS